MGQLETCWKPTPEQIEKSHLKVFWRKIEQKYQKTFADYQDFHRFSVEQSETFWCELMQDASLEYEGSLRPVVLDKSFKSYAWFPQVKLNFAQNLLSKRPAQTPCLTSLHESGMTKTICYDQLLEQVARLQQFISPWIKPGDVLAAFMPNTSETIVSMLATTALGGVFTSTSCDFGVEGVLDRFGQSKPKVLVVAAAYTYNGKRHCNMEKIAVLEKELPSLEKIIIVDFLNEGVDLSTVSKAYGYAQILSEMDASVPTYQKVNFGDPVYIMYSSGTTGKPKCIVHGVGGVLLKHYSEHKFHTNISVGEKLFYFTTCGWMMWNWLVSGLMVNAHLVLYEGSPGYPSLEGFMQTLSDQEIDYLGTSPKFLKALEDAQVPWPKFSKLKTILSTGSPLLAQQYGYVAKHAPQVQLASISGGTDILGCFMLGNPLLPVIRGEIQCLALGMDVSSFDENGHEVLDTEGELVCRQSFPSRPIYFLNDPNDEKLIDAYFSRYQDVWTHGDFIVLTKRKTVRVFGRSDATLNPGGVRIGTAEIYAQTERLDFIEDSLCVGRESDGDVEVILFVKCRTGLDLNEDRISLIKKTIRQKTTPRHVPAQIYQVQDIPYTRSGKKMELAITRILAGKDLTNIEAVANPECLEEYKAYSASAS